MSVGINTSSSVLPNGYGALAAIQKRRVRRFDENDRTRSLVQIPNTGTVEYFDIFFGFDQTVAMPNPDLDFLSENAEGDWFLTTTHLFPTRRDEVAQYSGYPWRNECLLISLEKTHDVVLLQLVSPDARKLPSEWWLEIDNIEYRRHPKFGSIATSETGLIRIDGNQINIGLDHELPASAIAYGNAKCLSDSEWMTVQQLVEGTWKGDAPHVRG